MQLRPLLIKRGTALLSFSRALRRFKIFQDYASARKVVIKKAELEFIDFVISAASNSAFREDLYWQIENFRNKSNSDKMRTFPGFYLFVERYIFNSVESNQHHFREAIYSRFADVINRNSALKLIFLPPAKQVVALYRRFLFSVASRTQRHMRSGSLTAQQLVDTLNNVRKMMATECNHGINEAEYLIKLSHSYFSTLTNEVGERIALKIYNDAYDRQLLRYQNLSTFPEVVRLFTTRGLDDTKYNLMSIQQMKTLLADKVEKLELLSEELGQKNKQLENQYEELTSQSEQLNMQNERLMEAQTLIEMMNDELGLYNRRLEEKVEERTRELAHSNKLLNEYNDNLEQYTFAISHQLKAPIARLLGLTNLLRILPEEEKPVIIDTLYKSGKELDGIFKDLVHSLNLKHEVASRNCEKVDIVSLIHAAWSQTMINHKFPEAWLRFPTDSPCVIETDRAHLHDALIQVYDNALKFRKPDQAVEVETMIEMKDGRVTLKIADKGIGFDSDMVHKRMFTPFARFNDSFPGRGMGLYLTRQHVSIVGGEIRMNSKLDVGTEVEIVLPVKV